MNDPNLLQSRALAVFLACGITACASYEPRPLPDWSMSIGMATTEPTEELTFGTAVAWLLEHNEPLAAARGRLATARALAAESTPLANPTLGIGPVFLSGLPSVPGSEQALEAALGWVLPLSGVRGATDALHDAKAQAAHIEVIVVARQEYLALRGELLALAVQVERARQMRQAHRLLQGFADQQRSLGAAGASMDLHLAELAAMAADSNAAGHESSVLRSQGLVARRCGAPVDRVTSLPLRIVPKLPAQIVSIAVLVTALEQHPDLVALRADYDVAERDLRREVRKQYPDLALGGVYEREEGTRRLALPLGFELPVFDTNQQGIAQAEARRTALRQRYDLRVLALQQAVVLAREVLLREFARYQTLDGKLNGLIATIRSSVDTLVGAARMSRRERAEIYRRVFEAQDAELDARDAVLQSWNSLERACGAPLLNLPGQPSAPIEEEIK
jgi:cobalt-zinc-cadmium efflux system outer membrane protein